jgi:hypothetical protein
MLSALCAVSSISTAQIVQNWRMSGKQDSDVEMSMLVFLDVRETTHEHVCF